LARWLFRFAFITFPTAAIAAPRPLGDDPPVEATFVDAAGKPVKLSDYRGKQSLVLLFMRGFKGDFACFFCGQQLHAYKDEYARLKDAGAEVLAILPGAKDARGSVEKVGTSDDHPDPDFTTRFRSSSIRTPGCRTFSVTFDPSRFSAPFPVNEPATVVLGKDGRVVTRITAPVRPIGPRWTRDPRRAGHDRRARVRCSARAPPRRRRLPLGAAVEELRRRNGLARATAGCCLTLTRCGEERAQMDTRDVSSQIPEERSRLVLVKVDHDAAPELVKQYGVQPLPDLRVLAPDGSSLTSSSASAVRPSRGPSPGGARPLCRHAPEEGDPATERARSQRRRRAADATPDAVGVAVLRGPVPA
jgi:peroxiredoxin